MSSRIWFVLNFIIIIISFLLVSCTTRKIIERKNLIKEVSNIESNATITFTDNKEIEAEYVRINGKNIDIIDIQKNIIRTNSNSRYDSRKVEYNYKTIDSIRIEDVKTISFKNRLRGTIAGLLGGVTVGIIGASFIPPTEGGSFLLLLPIGGFALLGTANGIYNGYVQSYTFFDDNEIFRFKKIRDQRLYSIKIGTSFQNEKSISPSILLGLRQSFTKKDIEYNFSYLTTTFSQKTYNFFHVREIEYLSFGYKYFFSNNQKISAFYGNNISLANRYFDNLSSYDIENDFYSGNYFGYRLGFIFGYDYIIRDKRYSIELTANLPLSYGRSKKRLVDEESVTEIKGDSYWFPTFSLTLGF